MEWASLYKLYGFYQNELRQNFLGFWLPRCEDKVYGGYFNCFDNSGENLVSKDKYAWSQGRFVWLFSRLACAEVNMFSRSERAEFLRLAKSGADFLMKHVLLGGNDWRCTFMMEQDGTPKPVAPDAPLDMSVYADCFVTLGLSMYACAARDESAYVFASRLYDSVVARVRGGRFNTLPYPLSPRFRAHGIPMILDNTARELYRPAALFDPDAANRLKKDVEAFAADVLDHFTDGDDAVHEIITRENAFFPQVLGQHINPGHSIEDVWFLLDAASPCGKPLWRERIRRIALKTLETGWDNEYGGLLHFSGLRGGEPAGSLDGVADEPMTKQLAGWSDKLWWVHIEALYSTLRCWLEGEGDVFREWYDRVFAYTFATFPNDNPEVREWKQIRLRNGSPQDKVVALPVKDPFHIGRGLILILELLEKAMQRFNA